MPRLRRPHIADAPGAGAQPDPADGPARPPRQARADRPRAAARGHAVRYLRREELFGVDTPVRVGAAIVMVVLGWALARDLGRFTAPALFRRMDPATAGTVGFLIRLVFLPASALFALRAAGLQPETLAVGGAITAVVFGLAAQQTLGNLIAGMVLISARPFKVGDRVRLQAGGIAGQIEGVVASLGLLYTTFAQGQDSIMVPNNVVLTAAVVPLREPGVGRPARAAAARRQAERPAGAARGDRRDAGALGAAHLARGGRPRRGDRPDRGHAGDRLRRPAAGRRGPGRHRRRHARGRRPTSDDDEPATTTAAAPTRSAAPTSRRSTSELALVALARLELRRRSRPRPSLRCTFAAASGARPANAVPSRSGSGATSTSERSRSIARDDRVGRRPRASWCRRRPAAWRRTRGTCRRRG